MGRKYQWLIMGTYSERWWLDETAAPCPLDQLQAALEGCILTDLLPLATSGEITVSGIVSGFCFMFTSFTSQLPVALGLCDNLNVVYL